MAIYQPWPQHVFTNSGRSVAFTGPSPLIVFTNPDPGHRPQFAFTTPGQNFTTTTTPTSTITTTSTITITTATTTTFAITTTIATTTTYANNKRCLCSSKIYIKWPLKGIWWKSKSCLSKFVNIMANVFLIRKAAFIFKEIGSWVFLRWMQIITESIKINKSRTSWNSFSFRSFWYVSEPIRFATKKKL